MSQAGLLHHFANKNELLAAVLELRDDLSREYTTGDEEDGLETIRGLIRLVEYNATVPGLVELHTTLSAEATAVDHPAHEYFVRRYAWVSSFITSAFERMKANGQLVPGVEPQAAARGMIAVIDGVQVQWLLDRDSLDMAEETRMFVRLLITVDL